MTAADTWGIEVVPDEGPKAAFPVNQELINKRGIYNLENLNVGIGQGPVLCTRFLFAPVNLKGTSGSPGNSIAMR